MTVILEPPAPTIRLLWVDLTRKCQLNCTHCLNDSGPTGDHGTMTSADWTAVLDQAYAAGIEEVRFFGGEPTLHPDALDLVGHALDIGLSIEVFSNLVHVSDAWWDLLARPGAALATSYYSDEPAEHDAITSRASHARTRANIIRAVERGILLRVEVIAICEGQRTAEAAAELRGLGVENVRVASVRPFGRAADGQDPDTAELCGRCGTGTASIGPDGVVSPCVFSTFISVGNTRDTALAGILHSPAMTEANATIRAAHGPDDDDGGDDKDAECSPGFPGSGCSPRN
ncbi:radical SAM protein [Actinocorallia libanotica]|uniref:Radical SAM core domain-containing protein n=1 Tax=Actinocorallia libanotica TaxID=46162 RepID=A0ABP4CFZ9_9ACTN